MKKIFFISEAVDGSYYYRVEVFKRYTQKFEVLSNVDYEQNTVKDPFSCLDQIFDSDIVVFLRPIQRDYFLLVPILNHLGIKVGFSSDDHLDSLDKKNPAYGMKKDAKTHDLFLENASFAIASTAILNNEYSKLNKNVYTIPNLIDFGEYSKNYQKGDDKEIRIGLVGSVQWAENVEKFTETLKEIRDLDKRVKLVFFGGGKPAEKLLQPIFRERSEFVSLVKMADYSKKLSSLHLDIALIPRKDNYFNRCKSNCKYLEMSALKIATVAQGFKDGLSPYQADITSGENGFIVVKEEEWLKTVTEMVKNKAKMDEVKEKAFEYVRNGFDVQQNINLWDKVYEKESQSINRKNTAQIEAIVGLLEGFTSSDSQRARNFKKEITYLNSEIDRIRSRLPYRLAAKASSSLKKFR